MRYALLVVLVACIPHTRSGDYQCSTQADCKDGRVCMQGYCTFGMPLVDAFVNNCPPGCDQCDEDAMTCQMSCTSPNACQDAKCPAGYECDIVCTTNGCPTLDCTDARRCNVTCSGNNACGTINCGQGRCDIECASSNACNVIDCADSCSCDIDCPTGTTCAVQSCPMPNGMLCTEDTTNATPCDGIGPPECDTCP